jgi:tetratricopeptide (TPR) repeat protein
MNISRKLGLIFLLLAIVCVTFSNSQQLPDETSKFRLAQNLDRSGEYEKAARLYEELLSKDPGNYVYFESLHRMYVQLKEYPKAIDLIQPRLKKQPNDLNLLGLLGEDYLKAGQETEAYSTWDRALATDEKNPNVYRMISNVIMQNRLFGKATEVLLRGRQTIGNPNLFANELGYAYTLQGRYTEATREYLRTLKENPGLLNFIESRLTLFTGKPEGLQSAVSAVQEAVREDKKDVNLQRLLAWVYLEGKQFENAFSVYRTIEQINPSGGEELIGFANRALKEKAYEVTAKAYREIIDRYPKAPIVPMAKFGYARVVEELSAARDTLPSFEGTERREVDDTRPASESQPSYGGAIAYYQEVAREYPRSEVALQALYRIGLIKFERFFDLDGALRTLEDLEQRFPNSRISAAVALKAGEILLARGDLEKASERFNQAKNIPSASGEERNRATFELAELDYFQGHFDSALVKLNQLLNNLTTDIANDALLLQQFIKEHSPLAKNPQFLKDFAHAELLKRQRKFSEASAVLEQLSTTSSSSPIIDDVLLALGELQTKLGNPRRGISFYEKLIFDHPESILRDKAQFSIGEVYQFRLKDTQKAIAAYQTLLENYPNSLFLDEARKRIRQLRGDNL